ncbi:hypothetical protein [Dyadobacter psychrophilus]|uniref:Uncharacterized protein n=1 Tax=Dyadobacter psychrophilus TaxID=651661 RepID=A0A1T5HDT4_9BACT|nr:hypothetical protein [Dyadobacter psychrophilus]SKC18877.1 hypothetical protein SAMN05660293_05371 [Dyadobacter psychrophilus]
MKINENSPQDMDSQDRGSQDLDAIDRDGLPPFVSSWKQLYQLLIGTLVLLIVLFYLFMTHFQ